jgi:hypothetical protein
VAADPPVNVQQPARSLLLLDACCLLNIFATGHVAEILETLNWRFAIAIAVAREAMWIYRGGEGEDARERDPVNTQPLVDAGLLEVLGPEVDTEVQSFVALAAVLDDGEAMTAALAIHRQAAVATDDRKAIREIRSRAPSILLLSTATLLHTWAQDAGLDKSTLQEALGNVRSRARFLPSPQDPLRAWWDSVFAQ